MAFARVNEWSSTAASNTELNGISIAEGTTQRASVNNAMREMMRQVRLEFASKGSDITSVGGAPDIGAATGQYVLITGTTTITSFGTVNAGTMRWVQFDGALTLTHNGTSLILPGSANITTAQGDVAEMVSLGSGNWKCLNYFRVSGKPVVSGTVGKHKLWIPASAMRPGVTATPASADVAAGNLEYYVLDFDQTAIEEAWFSISMPSSADETVAMTFVPVWTAASGSGDVVWTMFSWARGNDDAITDAGFPTGATSTDTLIAAGDLHRGPESSSMTPDDTWAANDTIFFNFLRNGASGSDTLNADARLIGVELYITTNEAVDVA